jgi:hypothetical protein
MNPWQRDSYRLTAKRAVRRPAASRVNRAKLDALVADATVDCYNEDEQRTGLLTMIQEHLALPFNTQVLGVPVVVERIDINSADEIVALCRRGRDRQAIPILDLPLPSPPPAGFEWIAAYRHWARP